MQTIHARNVNDAWFNAKRLLLEDHIVRPSRYGEVWEFPTPVTTVYEVPSERVLFDIKRDANPFFHFFEALWMLAGRRDVAWPAQFASRMKEFSDDGIIYHGAYGYRWRKHFGIDQIPKVIKLLTKSHDERRAVMGMWDPTVDLDRPEVKDLPCNTTIYFKIREGKLTITVCNRSNDIVWGAYGANLCQMSMLQEYIAAAIGVPMGEYYQVSDSWHAYTKFWSQYVNPEDRTLNDLYRDSNLEPYPMVTVPGEFLTDLQQFFEECENPSLESFEYRNAFFPEVARPLYAAWKYWKRRTELGAEANAKILDALRQCRAADWTAACVAWMLRRAGTH